MAEDDPVGGVRGRVRTNEIEGLGKGAGAGEIQTGEGQAGRCGVDVRVGERRSDQRPFEVDHFVDAAREGVGGPFGAHPGDMAAFDDHGGGEGVGGAVDVSTAQQHGAVFALGAVLSVMTPVSRLHGAARSAPPSGPAAGVSQICGGRASYGVERTTVVRVETPASERIRVSRCSSSSGVATRTLRM